MATEEYTYSYKPRLMGPSYEFQLSKDALDWTIGVRTGRVSYPMIKHIRLGYKPTNMANARFIAEIWPLNAPKIALHSVSAQSLVNMADQGKEYSNFVRELHRRVSGAKADCVYDAGFPAWRWWPSVFVALLVLIAVGYVVVQGAAAGQYWVAAVIALVGAWFLWQIWNIVVRNRPRLYDPRAIPDDIMPAG
jgi:hypothetical protein